MRPEILAEYLGLTIRGLFVPLMAREAEREQKLQRLEQTVGAVADRVAGLEARAPVPGPPGRDGADGKDGLGFDEYTVTHDGERTFTHVWTNGERRKEMVFRIPAPIYRGWFVRDKRYELADRVTCNGAEFHCNIDTTRSPSDGSKEWTLVAKSGKPK